MPVGEKVTEPGPIYEFCGNEHHCSGSVQIIADGQPGYVVVRRIEGGAVFQALRTDLEDPIDDHPFGASV